MFDFNSNEPPSDDQIRESYRVVQEEYISMGLLENINEVDDEYLDMHMERLDAIIEEAETPENIDAPINPECIRLLLEYLETNMNAPRTAFILRIRLMEMMVALGLI